MTMKLATELIVTKVDFDLIVIKTDTYVILTRLFTDITDIKLSIHLIVHHGDIFHDTETVTNPGVTMVDIGILVT